MPMDFPDMKSLEMAARVHDFRETTEGETEKEYRNAFADHVLTRDAVESEEIRNGVGWDKFTNEQNRIMINRQLGRKL